MAPRGPKPPGRPDNHPRPCGEPPGPPEAVTQAPEPAPIPPTPPASPAAAALADQVVLLLVGGLGLDAAERYCRQRGLDGPAAAAAMVEARKRITLAADYARDEQLGKAVKRLEDLYAKSLTAKDTRTALQAQRELNRLLDLYAPAGGPDGGEVLPGEAGGAEDLARRLTLIAAYLLPLELTDARYPVEEHARVASELLHRQKGV
jgi:hypothetical protein